MKFFVGGSSADKPDQKALQELRALADGYGMTVEEAISTAIDQFVASCEAEQKPKRTSLRFRDRPMHDPTRVYEVHPRKDDGGKVASAFASRDAELADGASRSNFPVGLWSY